MNYTQAVALAKAGKEEGYEFLYKNTYQSKYYLALRYVKDEEAAKDVLQDSYIKAFAKLDTLENPEAFASWLGQIVANTAKNILEKKTPLLFSDIAVDEEGENFEFQIEDDNLYNQPEVAYTKKETQELVNELIDSLSEEQRLCILLFHIEGASICEIAKLMNCSENTVKSRLNYGRKNLKARAEELQKKGYKLYSIAPLPLLLLLLRTDMQTQMKDGTIDTATKGVEEAVRNATIKEVGNAVKAGFMHTVTGKITIAVVGLGMTGAAIFAGKQILMQPSSVPIEATDQLQEPSQNEESAENTDETYQVADSEEAEQAESTTETNTLGNSVKEVYQNVLQAVQNKEAGYEFTAASAYTGEYRYFIKDINGDGIMDLIVGATYQADVFNCSDIRAFTCKPSGDGYELKVIGGEVAAITISIAGDGNGLFSEEFSRGTGQTEVYRITIENDTLTMNRTPEMQFILGDSASMDYNNANPLPEWKDVSDATGLGNVK